ncbi:P22AR C-terminal domain-containing protein [Aggregatibacter actinomycetemcomitans]|uniref:P22AR C-terminal domain-containing protein n=1 Tax=Aggregatibacter actinomycetemcomitans TaxID=714 RepID=UPI001E54EFCB|nr:P22AR C-terminal domain-containing protein [Aggregatibacter actinomycetemcomitans]
MNTQIQFSTFNFKDLPVRVISDPKGDFWFCGTDVCAILGYTNSRKALQDHCKQGGVTKRYTPTKSADQEMTFINEPNLYRLIIKSRKPEAEPFEAWVFEEVLPQIRKTGKYEAKTTADDRTGLRNAVNMLVSKKGLIYSEAYNLVHQYMNVERIEDIPADKLQSAVEYVHRIVLEGELITEPKKDELFTREFTEHELQQLVWAWFALLRGTELCQNLLPALKQIGSHYAAPVHDIAYEYRSTIRQAHNVLSRITDQFECKQSNNWRVLKYLRAYNPKATGFQLDIL